MKCCTLIALAMTAVGASASAMELKQLGAGTTHGAQGPLPVVGNLRGIATPSSTTTVPPITPVIEPSETLSPEVVAAIASVQPPAAPNTGRDGSGAPWMYTEPGEGPVVAPYPGIDPFGNVIPLPGPGLLTVAGLAGLAAVRRRRA